MYSQKLSWISPVVIRRLRRRLAISQRELSRRARVSNALISRLERRRKDLIVSREIHFKLARGLKVDPQVVGKGISSDG